MQMKNKITFLRRNIRLNKSSRVDNAINLSSTKDITKPEPIFNVYAGFGYKIIPVTAR
jgi:hypothetical protein